MKLNEIVEKQPIIYVLVGLPGSGKSTYIKKLLEDSNKEFVIVSTDNELERIAKEQNKTYSDVFNDNIKLATSLMNDAAQNAIKERKNIIWDQTNLYEKKRRKILNSIPKEYRKIAIVFQVGEDVLFSRLKDREETGKIIPKHVIDNFIKTFEFPTKDEGFDEIITIKY